VEEKRESRICSPSKPQEMIKNGTADAGEARFENLIKLALSQNFMGFDRWGILDTASVMDRL